MQQKVTVCQTLRIDVYTVSDLKVNYLIQKQTYPGFAITE